LAFQNQLPLSWIACERRLPGPARPGSALLAASLSAAEPTPVSITLDGLSGNSVQVNEFLMDATHSNAYQAWQHMGSPAHPTAEQIEKLQKAGALEELTPNPHLPVRAGKVTFAATLPRQGVMLIRLKMRQKEGLKY
jgi:beta-xylosidase